MTTKWCVNCEENASMPNDDFCSDGCRQDFINQIDKDHYQPFTDAKPANSTDASKQLGTGAAPESQAQSARVGKTFSELFDADGNLKKGTI